RCWRESWNICGVRCNRTGEHSVKILIFLSHIFLSERTEKCVTEKYVTERCVTRRRLALEGADSLFQFRNSQNRKMLIAFVKQIMRAGCWRYQRLLSPYLDGELGRGAAARVESHMDGCAACRARAENMRFAARLVANSRLPGAEPAPAPLWIAPGGAANPV